jgi:hypothetical protein
MGGYDGTSFSSGWNGGAEMLSKTTENWTSTAKGASLSFQTTPNGSAIPVERIKISENGNVGIGQANPFYKLEVAGDIFAYEGAFLAYRSSNEGGNLSLYNAWKTGAGTILRYAHWNMTGPYGDKYSIWAYSQLGTIAERFSIWDIGDFSFHNSSGGLTAKLTNSGNFGINTSTPQSRLEIGGSLAYKVVSKSSNATAGDETIILASNTITITLPSASVAPGRIYIIKRVGAGNITIAPASGQSLEGILNGTQVLTTANQRMTVASDGSTGWFIVD